jgi:hypothetical protein
MHYVRESADNKEEIMKRLIYLAVVLMIGLTVMRCASVATEQRKEEPNLSTSVGNTPFVGFNSDQARDLAYGQMYGR